MKRWSAFLTAAAVLTAVPVAARASGEMDVKSSQAGDHDGTTHYAEPYVGHSVTKKVHLRGCEWAGKIAEANRVYFKTCGDAAEKGYAACKVCAPDRALPPNAAPEPRSTASSPARASTPFVGHRVTRKAHRASCEWAEKISVENRVGFATWKEAQVAGYVACGKCKPDVKALAAEPPAARESGAPEKPAAAASAGAFIGHKEKKKVHRADCRWAQKMSEKNRAYFNTYQEAAAAGYSPCKACKADEAPSPSPGNPGGPAPAPDSAQAGAETSAPQKTPAAGELCASSNGKTFHTPDCAWAKKISGRNLVVYKTRDDAIASGKAPCKACKP